ncbi:hypothetical protein ACFLRW_04235 [Acidobacteriota bacterium]
MSKIVLIIGLFVLFTIPITAQELVDEDDSIWDGNSIFKAVLSDANFVPFDNSSSSSQAEEGIWILKFKNGAVVRIKSSIFTDPAKEIWWIGKKYIVFQPKPWFRMIQVRLLNDEWDEKTKSIKEQKPTSHRSFLNDSLS